MSIDENKKEDGKLMDGDDSGPVPDGVRFQIFVDGLGICAAPGCPNRSVHHRTKLSECAHIIPRRVGSHPREDYVTPLSSRKQEPNLLYLCTTHHKLVDDIQHADLFPADELRRWKRDHEEWAKSVTKESPYLPTELKELLASMGKSVVHEANQGKIALRQIVDVCRNLLECNRLTECQILLAQIATLAIRSNDEELIYEIELLNARILRATQKIPESKSALIELIHLNGTKSAAMAEYVELCKAAPEPKDEVDKIEPILRKIDPQNPSVFTHDLINDSQKKRIPWKVLPAEMLKNRRVCEHIFSHNCAVLDEEGNKEERDKELQHWSRKLKDSAKPLLFRAAFTSVDALRTSTNDVSIIAAALTSIKQIEDELQKKSHFHSKIGFSWNSINSGQPCTLADFLAALQRLRIVGEP